MPVQNESDEMDAETFAVIGAAKPDILRRIAQRGVATKAGTSLTPMLARWASAEQLTAIAK